MRQLTRTLLVAAVALRLAGAAQIDPQRYLEHIKVLASDQMKGRGDGTPELDAAASYIAAEFKAFGLKPLTGGSYLQPLPITWSASLGEANRLEYSEGAKKTSLKFNEEFRPLSFSSAGKVTARVVFAGYGITAHEYGYDDYAGLDVKNKLVLVLRHEPQEFDAKSIFSGRVFTNHAQFEAKAFNAKRHGAAGVVFVSDRPSHPNEAGELVPFSTLPGPPSAGIPFVEIKSEVADQWLKPAGHSLAEVINGIDRDLRPRSFALPASLEVGLAVDVRQETRMVENVVGYLEGLTDEYVILGAHYDHVGLGEQFSMSGSGKGSVHPGADDNASGVAGVLELARWFGGQPKRRRGVLFVAFAAEEIGLVGSNYYAENPALDFGKAVLMFNMDMIGRLRGDEVFVGGVTSGKGLGRLLERQNQDGRLKLNSSDSGGYGSSDQFSFIPKEIPVLFFFTGLHPDYHTPADTWDKIDAPGAARIVGLAGAVVERLREERGKPRFLRKAH